MIPEFLRHLSLELYRSNLTVEAYATDLYGFNSFLNNSDIAKDDAGFFIPSEVTPGDVRDWLISLSEAGMAPTSIRRKMASLRAYFKYLLKKGIISSNPASVVALPKKRRKLPEIATHQDIVGSAAAAEKTRDSLILEMLYGCGLRRAELLAVNDNDINLYNKELRILGKGNKERIIPLPDALLGKIKAWQSERDALYPDLLSPKPLLATMHGRMSVSTLYNTVRNALQSSNAARKSPHTLRHSFATQLLNAGADIFNVKELLGHASLNATQIYTHMAFSDLNRDWEKAHPRARGKKN